MCGAPSCVVHSTVQLELDSRASLAFCLTKLLHSSDPAIRQPDDIGCVDFSAREVRDDRCLEFVLADLDLFAASQTGPVKHLR